MWHCSHRRDTSGKSNGKGGLCETFYRSAAR
jgi:hypothetical protein